MSKVKFSMISVAACLFLAASFSACKPKSEADVEHPLIAAYTSGTISIQSPVRVVFMNDAMKVTPQPGDPVADGVLKFSPSVAGKAVWINNTTIEFVPDKPFEAGHEYKVTLRISKLTDVGTAPKNFTFTINTIIPTFYHRLDGLSLYNKTTSNLYYLTGTVSASDFIPADKVEKLLTVKSDNKGASPLVIKWEHDYTENKHFFRIDSIKAGASRYDIRFQWNGQGIDYDYNNEETISVPAEHEFDLINVQVVNTPEQYIQCTFSEPIDEKQRLLNFFSLSNNVNLKFAVELNIVRIYPITRQTGTYELSIEKGLKTTSGKKLAETFVRKVSFDQLKPAVKFVGKGVILPNSSGLHITFQAVNYQSVDMEVYRIYENNILQFLQINKLDGADELYRVGKRILVAFPAVIPRRDDFAVLDYDASYRRFVYASGNFSLLESF